MGVLQSGSSGFRNIFFNLTEMLRAKTNDKQSHDAMQLPEKEGGRKTMWALGVLNQRVCILTNYYYNKYNNKNPTGVWCYVLITHIIDGNKHRADEGWRWC